MKCVVTGGNAGIGRATVEGLLRAGADVVMICRDPARAENAAGELERATGRRPRPLIADLACLADVVRAAREIERRDGAIDVLINNAAILPRRRETSRDGFELQFAVNHLAYHVLTRELLPALQRSGAGRVVVVASNAHRRGALDLDDLEAKRRYHPVRQYCATKLMNVLFAAELAERVRDRGITVNSLHPGVIGTGLLTHYLPLGSLLKPFLGLITGKPEEGCRTSLHLALSSEVAGVTGKYFRDCREATPSPLAQDAQLRSKLYDSTERIVRSTEMWGRTAVRPS